MPDIPKLDLNQTEKFNDLSSSMLFKIAPAVELSKKLIRDEFSVTITSNSVNNDDRDSKGSRINILHTQSNESLITKPQITIESNQV